MRTRAVPVFDHVRDDGDAPDIPIPIDVGDLNRIREMAQELQP